MTLAVAALNGLRADLRDTPPDLKTPPLTFGKPVPGKRVRSITSGYESTALYQALYLPTNWKPGKPHPVIVEYPGNGPYTNRLGDTCDGTVEGCNLGYGISAGSNFIWICMPFVGTRDAVKGHSRQWWGDPDETALYCRRTVHEICARYSGDTNALLLAGFSRGAIAGNFIGLRNEEIASVWRAFVLHSHYDGVRTNWPYAGADRASALVRLQRLRGRPQWISQETSVEVTRDYLQQTGAKAPFTFQALAYPNHCDDWVLRDVPERRALRAWIKSVLNEQRDLPD